MFKEVTMSDETLPLPLSLFTENITFLIFIIIINSKIKLLKDKVEDTKRIITSSKSKSNTQYNGQYNNDKRTNKV